MSYIKKKEMIAMLLAGGQGSRLGVLTNHVAKPAVPFGGKYRIIDFPLSNCVNSGVDTIGVLTQYQPLELNAYIGNGQPWDLDRLYGGAAILPPYVKGKEGKWYKGTANAIYQNIQFIEQYHPEYVLILSGDHVYKMNYHMMLDYHKERCADCTIAVIRVSMEEASRFGVMNTDENMRIFEFEEKPKIPKSNLASMGVYIFTWEKLKEYLVKDESCCESENDFGKNVIPSMLTDQQNMYAYEFKGYWKDVGTVESLWEANMDVLNPDVPLKLYDPPWKIYSRSENLPPQYVGQHAKLNNCNITEGCDIDGEIENSILFPGVQVGEGAVISNSIIMTKARIEKGAVIEYVIAAPETHIGEGAHIGYSKMPEVDGKHREITVLGKGVTVAPGAVVPSGAVIAMDVKSEESPVSPEPEEETI